jgi:hypothetical protein
MPSRVFDLHLEVFMKILHNGSLCGLATGLLLIAGCGEPAALNRNVSTLQSGDGATDVVSANLGRPAVDAGELEIFGAVVANTTRKGISARSLHFSASGEADYVEIKLCELARGCNESILTVVNQALLPIINPGQHSVEARACVAEKRAINTAVQCGAWSYLEFSAPNTIDTEVSTLIGERSAKKIQLQDLSKQVLITLDTFQKEAATCRSKEDIAKRITGLRGIAQNYLALGEILINQSLHGDTESQAPSLATAVPVQKVTTPLAANAEKLTPIERYDAGLRKLGHTFGYFDEVNPVKAVETLGLAVFDFFSARASIPGECLAKDKADSTMESIAANIAALKLRISEIDNALAERSVP